MWLVILSVVIVATYDLIYSILLLAYANPATCYFGDGDLQKGKDVLTIFSRLLQYIVWLLPVISVFWPPGKRITGCDKICCFSNKKKKIEDSDEEDEEEKLDSNHSEDFQKYAFMGSSENLQDSLIKMNFDPKMLASGSITEAE
jgi:hypothetical protein